MADITTDAPLFYNNGTGGATGIVGYESSHNRIACYPFMSPAVGATSLTFTTPIATNQTGTVAQVRFYIGTSSTSHVNGGATSDYTGVVTMTFDGNYYYPSGSATIQLLPNTQYYLWIFPGTTTYGYWAWGTGDLKRATITPSGSLGLVWIDNGSAYEAYQAYIDTGSGWDLYMPYTDNGSSWDLMS